MLPEVPTAPLGRRVFCNRTLNMRSIKAIGYDMDYTLVHYRTEVWEARAYDRARDRLVARGWPCEKLRFDPDAVIRGLVIDTERGNLVKANRFGFVKKAVHGTADMDFDEMRHEYARTIIDLHQPRWVFLNTLFSLSEACLYGQLVDLLDDGKLPAALGYRDLYEEVRKTIDALHVEGELKADIVSDPERYVFVEPETTLTLQDQRHAGKKLLLITNSEWGYTERMMNFAFGNEWRELFEVVVCGARKPEFFTTKSPFFEIVSDDGLLRPLIGEMRPRTAYFGGSALQVERHLGISGDEILYVGDHMFGDVHVTNRVLRWRTALILRELESEVEAIQSFHPQEKLLETRMIEKEMLENELSFARLSLQRLREKYGPQVDVSPQNLQERITGLRNRLITLDAELAPMAKAATALANPRWGLLTRAGNDKSHLARQVERYADIYTSRVSNLLYVTPFVYMRSPRGSLPHDPSTPGGTPIA